MPSFDGITINIRVDDNDLVEFMVERDLEQKKVSCWVPSQLGKQFDVMVHNAVQRNEWTAGVKADGIMGGHWVFDEVGYLDVGFFQESTTAMRPFTFAELEIVDDDSVLGSHPTSGLGEIEIRCIYSETTQLVTSQGAKRALKLNNRIHAKSKLGITQHIGFGEEVPDHCQLYKLTSLDHIVTFVFRYRPLEYLQAQGIAPRESPLVPPPPPPPDDTQNSRHDSPDTGRVNMRGTTGVKPERSDSEPEKVLDAKGGRVKESSTSESEDDDEEIMALQILLSKLKERRQRKRRKNHPIGAKKKSKREEGSSFVPSEVIDLT